MAIAILYANSAIAEAAAIIWNVPSGDWSTASYWGGIEPTSSDSAYISNDGSATVTQSGEACLELNVGDITSAGGSTTGSLLMTGGSLTATFDKIGDHGNGSFTQTVGNHTVTFLDMAVFSGVSGNYNLSGTGQLSSTDVLLGERGNGTFTQTGGVHTAGNLTIGMFSGSNGIYNLSAGSNIVTDNIYLGYYPGASGTYNLKRYFKTVID